MTGFFEDQALRFEGLDDKDIADINVVLPDIEHLIGVVQAELPRINRVLPVILRVAQKVIQKQKELKS